MDLSPLWISLRAVVLAIIGTSFLAIIVARWRFRHGHSKTIHFWDSVLLLPIVLPPTVIGLVLLTVFGRHSPVGQFLQAFGMNIVFSWPATVIAAMTMAFPIMYQAALASFRMIDKELMDAARVSGCTDREILWYIMIPLAWPGIAAGLLLSSARALGDFGATLMLAGNIPSQTQTLPIAVFYSIESGDYTTAYVLAGILVGISSLILWILNRLDHNYWH